MTRYLRLRAATCAFALSFLFVGLPFHRVVVVEPHIVSTTIAR